MNSKRLLGDLKFESCLDEGKTDCDDSEVDNFLRLLGEGRPVVMVPPDYPVSGLRRLLELELNKFESCLDEGKTDCDDSEVDNILRLLGEGRPVVKVPPVYPVSGLRDSLSAEVIVQVTVTKSGEVVRATATSCKFGRGPRDIKHRWEDEGRPCKAFRRKAEIAALKWSYSPIISIEREEYSRYAKVGFDLSDYSDFWKVQFVDIKERDTRKIVKLKKEKSWRELKEFVEGKQDESPVFTYHLAIAQQKLGEGTQALASLERFLERGRNQYVHYGALAASMVIDARYSQQKDDAVVAAGGHYNLMSYYLNGKQFSKYKAGLSLMRLASSLTFVKPQQLGKSLKLLNDLKANIELVKDTAQRADLEAQVDAQLDNLKAQIGQIGARAN